MTDPETEEEPAVHQEPSDAESRQQKDETPSDAEPEGRAADDTEEGEGQELPEEIREQLEELEELRDKHLRLAAEFDNYRKRTRREISSQQERAKAELAGRLLDVLDDLRRFNDAARDEGTDVDSLREGMELVERKLRKELGDAGLSPIEAAGEKFDPKLHEALTTTPVEDPDKDGYISQVLVDGYTFGEQLLRPARVEVMKYREPDEDSESSSEEA
ncbi:MAG: nucleotide exchange factor GrpE [Gemmatimonadota bacterium]